MKRRNFLGSLLGLPALAIPNWARQPQSRQDVWTLLRGIEGRFGFAADALTVRVYREFSTGTFELVIDTPWFKNPFASLTITNCALQFPSGKSSPGNAWKPQSRTQLLYKREFTLDSALMTNNDPRNRYCSLILDKPWTNEDVLSFLEDVTKE